jgi:hypothetical protein
MRPAPRGREKMIRPVHRQPGTVAPRAPRAILLLIDDVTRDELTSHVPYLVSTNGAYSAHISRSACEIAPNFDPTPKAHYYVDMLLEI